MGHVLWHSTTLSDILATGKDVTKKDKRRESDNRVSRNTAPAAPSAPAQNIGVTAINKV